MPVARKTPLKSTLRVVRSDPSKADLDNLLSYRLSVVSNLLSRNLLMRFEAISDISLPEWRILVLVNTYGPLSVKSLARHAGLDFGQASRVVGRMCLDGLIAKEKTADARSVNLSLTAEGFALHSKLWRAARQCNGEFLASLSDAERTTLIAALDTLTDKARGFLTMGRQAPRASAKRA